MPLFQNARYLKSAHYWQDLPEAGPPEIAFAGRSNAGKSTAINALANHNRLAFVSKTPGRTQQINFFTMTNGALLADLPGYGYAKVPADLRAHWERLLSRYLQERTSLIGLVIIMDIRHPLTPLDQQMLGWFAPTQKPVHVLLTKADKLSRRDANATLAEVQQALSEYPWISVQIFSGSAKTGVIEAEKVLGSWLPV